jgi:SAM-dependent methyltransferase
VWAGFGTWRAWQGQPLVRLAFVKEAFAGTSLYEKWNSFSRVAVFGKADTPSAPFGWGMSSTFQPSKLVPQLAMNIDGSAATVVTRFHGDPDEVDFLKYDVVNLAHHLRPQARVLAVGVGGGRDVLSALAFHQREVVGVEINDDILALLQGPFGDFAGHLERVPSVRLVNDEARSYIARTDEKFDIIQVSLIDTWAATAAGAFTFTESALYTVEAWKLFLRRLAPGGVLTFSRWYYGLVPAEMYRMVSLAAEALRQSGIEDPRAHILVGGQVGATNGVATILLSPQPFSDADVRRFHEVVGALQFETLLTPTEAVDDTVAGLVDPAKVADVLATSPLDLAAPTDDRPFFFHTLRWRSLIRTDLYDQGVTAFNMKAVFILGALLAVTVGLTVLCILVPLGLTSRRQDLRGAAPLFVFFAAIGVGFMLIEISQMQRLSVFLGHPTYGLTAALFSLLLASGVGSYSTGWGRGRIGGVPRLLLLLGMLALFGALTPLLVQGLSSAVTPVRIGAAVAMLAPLGFFMGMAFPLGMEVATSRSATLTPWLWGINGATSVCASVLALAVALTWGISAAFWGGFACYAVALAAYRRAARGTRMPLARSVAAAALAGGLSLCLWLQLRA